MTNLRVLVIGGILDDEQGNLLSSVLKTHDITISFIHYLTESGKELEAAVLDKYDVWVFKTAPSPVKLRNMTDEVEHDKEIFVPIYKDGAIADFQKIEM